MDGTGINSIPDIPFHTSREMSSNRGISQVITTLARFQAITFPLQSISKEASVKVDNLSVKCPCLRFQDPALVQELTVIRMDILPAGQYVNLLNIQNNYHRV
ncbi:MAG: hypothetical protein CVV30_05845 [Methanomicrobiales archaeon HGW-Methanomicrobiales-1]|jgi:hypothetical protein|nr:MAG: hypothetical protein CVV30_05845 [Methanomicrobiales archaeon HGW-Methanomicrobiales-1]